MAQEKENMEAVSGTEQKEEAGIPALGLSQAAPTLGQSGGKWRRRYAALL